MSRPAPPSGPSGERRSRGRTQGLSVEQAEAFLHKLQTYRVRPGRARDISSDIERVQTDADRTHAQLGPAIDAWMSAVPPSLHARSQVTGMRGGIMTVRADSSAVRYELDAMLRNGLLQALRSSLRAPLNRVKVQIGPPPR